MWGLLSRDRPPAFPPPSLEDGGDAWGGAAAAPAADAWLFTTETPLADAELAFKLARMARRLAEQEGAPAAEVEPLRAREADARAAWDRLRAAQAQAGAPAGA